jgi:hypothetical protein
MTAPKKKATGLAAFGAKTQPAQADATASIRQDVKTPTGKGETVACTVRLPRAAWLKIQHLALDEGTSFQSLAVAGLDNELKKRGLPGLE